MTKEKMKKRMTELLLLLMIGLYGKAEAAQAKGAEVNSRGAVVYQENGERAEIYAEDILFLKEKLDSISDESFSPSDYAHVHDWEYTNVDDRTHTEYCIKCEDAYAQINTHNVEYEEDCIITIRGKEYPGRRYHCECGQQWVQEAAHALVFEPVDENCHRSRCVLEEEGYCRGYEPVLEEHYAYYYIPDPDGTHHKKICFDCMYQVEEACDFTLESRDEEIEADTSLRYCACGNSRRTEEGETTELETDGYEIQGEQKEGSVSENSISENTIITEEEAGDTV